MTRLPTIFAGVLWLAALPVWVSAQEEKAWEIRGLRDENWPIYNLQTGEFIVSNGVSITYGQAVLIAENAQGNIERSGEVIADGRVRIQQGDLLWVGEHIRYNFRTHQIEAEQFRTGKPPAFIAGEGLQADVTNGVYMGTNAMITSDDIANPAIKIRAKYIKIIPGKRVEAHHATLYLGEVPVFYFPFYSRNLGLHANNLNVIPGYRSRFGPFLLGRYTWYLNDELDGVFHLDYRERRGIGVGPDFNYHLGPWGEGSLKYYYLHDEDPTVGATTISNTPVPPHSIPDNRQRLYFSYRASPVTNLEVLSMVRYQTDTNVLRDFFEGEYRQNPQPNSFFELTKFWRNFSLDTYVQPRVNDFFETVERLPEVRLTGYRQQVWALPVYYESQSSAGFYRRRFAETLSETNLNYEGARADTFHQLLLPETFFGWLNVTPRVGERLTYYSEARGPGATTEEVYRNVFNTGAEISFKASRVWPEARSQFLQIDGLRHIIEPSINYAYVPSPSRATNELPQFDYEVPSLRLLPIEFPDYNAIDSIDSQNVIRFGLHNKLQTKRKDLDSNEPRVENLVNWEVFTDWRLRPRPGQGTFGDISSDLTLKPRSWITFESFVRYDINRGNWQLASHALTLQPNNVWSWTLSHWYLRDGFIPVPNSTLPQGNNLLTSTMFYRVNENWGLRATHRFEARDGRLEEQAYSLYRDLRSWTAALTFRVLDNLNGPEDFTVAFTFSLKAHPRYGVGGDIVRPYSLWGGG